MLTGPEWLGCLANCSGRRFVIASSARVRFRPKFLLSGLQPLLRLKFVAATRLKSGVVALHYRRP